MLLCSLRIFVARTQTNRRILARTRTATAASTASGYRPKPKQEKSNMPSSYDNRRNIDDTIATRSWMNAFGLPPLRHRFISPSISRSLTHSPPIDIFHPTSGESLALLFRCATFHAFDMAYPNQIFML